MAQGSKDTFLYSANTLFIEELYKRYVESPDSIDREWSLYFDQMPKEDKDSILKQINGVAWRKGSGKTFEQSNSSLQSNASRASEGAQSNNVSRETLLPNETSSTGSITPNTEARLQVAVVKLIDAYRAYGHIKVKYDPLGLKETLSHAELDLSSYNITPEDLGKTIDLGGEFGFGQATVGEVIHKLEATYCSRVGAEFFYIEDFAERLWLQTRFENTLLDLNFAPEDKRKILDYLIEAENFEHYLHVKFPGTKRFSLEGGEAMIPALHYMITDSVQYGANEFIIGMAHRGRLNTLTHVMGKPYHAMLSEFKGEMAYPDFVDIPGDVKYHLGYSNDIEISGQTIHMSLTPNPSHLEAVNSIVLGKVRAKQDLKRDHERNQVLGLLVHGDAAFSGQGPVAESLYLSQLQGYHTGGTLHLIVNNQIGFTTNPSDGRSTRYCSDLAKAIDCPVLHVNGDDAESVVYACQLAAEYRAKFKKDVFIDLICYRKYGHNEGDEPFFTQPVMYGKIQNHQTPSTIYATKLIAEKLITQADYDYKVKHFKTFLDKEFELSKNYRPSKADWLEGNWGGLRQPEIDAPVEKTGYDTSKLKALMKKLCHIPEGFKLNSKVKRIFDARLNSTDTGENIDWGTGEALAFASLLEEGFPIRLSGQDVRRGTFSHRHAVVFDQETEKSFTPLNNIRHDQKAFFEAYNSNLSEFAVLAFEYGYSFTDPKKLVIWEAQFGDFANNAQVIIDQYIASGEAKWLRMNGLVLLLPHGYEGQGPEHSSARLERFLQLCSRDNMQVVNCSTPASIFHALRRQLHRNFRKPLIVMSPKSLLRHKLAVSKLEDFASGSHFQEVLGEIEPQVKPQNVKKVVLCSGKVFYDLYEARQENMRYDIALIRLEQLYPFAENALAKELVKYKNAEVIWCQEEHRNMGAFSFLEHHLVRLLKMIKHTYTAPKYIGRDDSPSPAVGYMRLHQQEQQKIIEQLFKK